VLPVVHAGEADQQFIKHWFAIMEDPAKQQVVPEDWDDFVQFINTHRGEIAEGAYDLRIEKDWARDLTDSDLLLLVRHCPSSRLTIATATKSVEVLEMLAGDPSSDVREAVADNLRTPAEMLDALSRDSISAVRMAVAGNPHTPANCSEELARDSVNYVRWAIANNERTSPAILKSLAKDSDPHVSNQAKSNPNTPKVGILARLLGRQ